MTDVDEYDLTTKDAAIRSGIPASTIRRYVTKKKLPSIKRGRDRYVRTSDVDKLSPPRMGRPPKE